MAASLDTLTPDTKRVAEHFERLAAARGIKIRFVSTFRTCAEQNAIYASNSPGKTVTGAAGCRSWHTWGRAFDVLIEDESVPGGLVMDGSDHRYDELADIGKTLGLIWGGTFSWGRDAGHFEYHPGMVIDDVCPNREPGACDEQIQRHNAKYNPPVDPSIMPVAVYESDKDVGLAGLVLSAFVGAVVFQAVSYTAQKYLFNKK